MTTRILPKPDWHRLAGTELETVWPSLPETAQVLVVEQDGAIVGCWALLPVLHVEGVWIAPEHRGKARVAARLLRGMFGLARTWRARSVTTGSLSPDVTAMITRLGGVPLPGEHFSIPVGEG